MKKIIAYAGSNSSTSINHRLVTSVASTIQNCEVQVLQLTDFPLPMYSEDIEKNEGFPEQLSTLLSAIKAADGVIISLNEHNGTVSAFFKNVLDWLSRIDGAYLQDKKVFLMSTSNGQRGAQTALKYYTGFLIRKKVTVVASLPFPSYSDNFDEKTNTIINTEEKQKVDNAIQSLVSSL